MIPRRAEEFIGHDLFPDLVTMLIGTAGIAIISAVTLPWHTAVASTLLGALMVTGADVDARTYLLPDIVTLGTIASGLVAAAVLDPSHPVLGVELAAGRAVATALTVAVVRWSYRYFRNHEGLGLGDLKLSAGVGAWLPLELIPVCFGFASTGALIYVLISSIRNGHVCRCAKIPFGAFLCPALWLMFFCYGISAMFDGS